ncbi:hypothetical protein [Arcobacter sp. CECT 8985]|uniref:hypothetical protein n=1 Tax=Arcobacter sp. CECT 8985 TaxID=1935424 RepID=UPI00100A4C68|nr:hypothetical protein [Arcobacter sp. CECT 8985]RXJ86257.1 hypothetical protein CRU93_09350 [Arcobacter sp. CECT 8985]
METTSDISVSASGLKIADELNILKKEDINEYTNVIIKNTKYLSNTIDIFSEYISGNSKEENINIQYFLNQTLNFEEANLKNHNIKLLEIRN